MEQIFNQLAHFTDRDRRHVERERSRERRHAGKEHRRAERHHRREEKRLLRAQRRARGERCSSSSGSESDWSDDERRRYAPGQGLGYSTFGPPTAGPGFPLMPNFAPSQPGFVPPPGPPPAQAFAPPPGPPPPPQAQFRGSPQPQGFAALQPPTYTPPAHHIQLHTNTPFPGASVTGHPVAADVGGQPVFLGLVHLHGGLHPCKVIPQYNPPVHVSWGGAELCPSGPYVLVPFDDAHMHWLHARDGHVPPRVRPVQGGYEQDGAPLYHALCSIHGVWVPGKTGHHLAGANAPFGNEEHHVREYQLLCWR